MPRSLSFTVFAVLAVGCGTSRPLVESSSGDKESASGITADGSDGKASVGKEPILSTCVVILPDKLAEVPTDRWVVVTSRDGSSSCEGRLLRTSAEQVVLTDGWSRTTSGSATLGRIPKVGRMFRNTGVARIEGEQAIPREQIASVVVYDEPDSARKFAEAARALQPQWRSAATPQDPRLDLTWDDELPPLSEGPAEPLVPAAGVKSPTRSTR